MVATTTPFRDFLKEVEAREKAPAVRERREEWVAALDRLLTRIEGWLKESDPDAVLDVYRREVEREEPGLGRYTAPVLVIEVGKVRVEVVPGSRASRAIPFYNPDEPGGPPAASGEALGRVEVANGSERYSLYRMTMRHTDGRPDEEGWVVLDPAVRLVGRTAQLQVLQRELFERVLRDLMS